MSDLFWHSEQAKELQRKQLKLTHLWNIFETLWLLLACAWTASLIVNLAVSKSPVWIGISAGGMLVCWFVYGAINYSGWGRTR